MAPSSKATIFSSSSSSSSSPSSYPIRAPLSSHDTSDEEDDIAFDTDTDTEKSFRTGIDDEYETASERPFVPDDDAEGIPPPPPLLMPIAKVSIDDDEELLDAADCGVDSDVSGDGDGEGAQGPVRVRSPVTDEVEVETRDFGYGEDADSSKDFQECIDIVAQAPQLVEPEDQDEHKVNKSSVSGEDSVAWATPDMSISLVAAKNWALEMQVTVSHSTVEDVAVLHNKLNELEPVNEENSMILRNSGKKDKSYAFTNKKSADEKILSSGICPTSPWCAVEVEESVEKSPMGLQSVESEDEADGGVDQNSGMMFKVGAVRVTTEHGESAMILAEFADEKSAVLDGETDELKPVNGVNEGNNKSPHDGPLDEEECVAVSCFGTNDVDLPKEKDFVECNDDMNFRQSGDSAAQSAESIVEKIAILGSELVDSEFAIDIKAVDNSVSEDNESLTGIETAEVNCPHETDLFEFQPSSVSKEESYSEYHSAESIIEETEVLGSEFGDSKPIHYIGEGNGRIPSDPALVGEETSTVSDIEVAEVDHPKTRDYAECERSSALKEELDEPVNSVPNRVAEMQEASSVVEKIAILGTGVDQEIPIRDKVVTDITEDNSFLGMSKTFIGVASSVVELTDNGSNEKLGLLELEANSNDPLVILLTDSDGLVSANGQTSCGDTMQRGTDDIVNGGNGFQSVGPIDEPVVDTQIVVDRESKHVDIDKEILEISYVTSDGVLDIPDDSQIIKVDAESADVEDDDLASEEPDQDLGPFKTVEEITQGIRHGSFSSQSGFESSQDYSHTNDGEIVTDSDEEVDTDEEGDGKELFDSAALNALLRAASNAGPNGGITITAPDTARFLSAEQSVGLGPTSQFLKPVPPRPNQSNVFSHPELADSEEPDSKMGKEEKKLRDKIQGLRVKYLRLVQRLRHSPEDTIPVQILHQLSLAEGIRQGRQTNWAFGIESARMTAMQMEAVSSDDLDFSCNILILGKTGVGKSATINSIFGEDITKVSAFEPGTTTVKEIVGTVDGVKIRIIDTPGLRSSIMDQGLNRKILLSIKKFTKRFPPDIVLYIDRLDSLTRNYNDLPLLKSISTILGPSIWLNAIVALTHAASAPLDGPNGSVLHYEVIVAQRSSMVQLSMRQAAGDMRLMSPVALIENHSSCRRNREGELVLPNGQCWRLALLLLCYSTKILSEVNSLLLQEPSSAKLFGLRLHSPPLIYLLSSLLQSRAHPKLSTGIGGDVVDSDVELDDVSDSDHEEEDEYDKLPSFKPLKKSQIANLSKEQRKAYFDEYEYRVKLLQKNLWKEELRRLKESKKRGREGQDSSGFGDMGSEEFDQENGSPATVPVPLPDMGLPPSFDGDNPTYRYRFLEPTSRLLARPVLDPQGWDHDCGYDGISLEESLTIAKQFPAAVSVQITTDKKDFSIHLDSSISAKHGENGSTLVGFDIQNVGRQLAYILRGETKFQSFRKNKTTAGVSFTFLGENMASGLKIEDHLSIGKQVNLVAGAGAVHLQGDVAYGANLEARLRDKEYPVGQEQSSLGLSFVKWRGDTALGANFRSQLSVGRNCKMAVRVGLNNKLSGQITVKTISSDQLQIALVGIIPVTMAILKTIWLGESNCP